MSAALLGSLLSPGTDLYPLFFSLISRTSILQGVRARFQASPSSTTLEQLVTTEVNEHQRHGTACLVRLIRYVARFAYQGSSAPT